MARHPKHPNPAREAAEEGLARVRGQPVLRPLLEECRVLPDVRHQFTGEKGWLTLTPNGHIHLHPSRRAEPEEWARLIATALVCLGFGLVRGRAPQDLWELACLLAAERFCEELKIGRMPEALWHPFIAIPAGGEEALFRQFCTEPVAPPLMQWRLDWCGGGRTVFADLDARPDFPQRSVDWKARLAQGIAQGVGRALRVVAGLESAAETRPTPPDTPAQRAKRRLMEGWPLLGALAAGFDLEQDPEQCRRYDIQVAAIDVGARRIWVNPASRLNDAEATFVFAHELLHAGLNHASRRRGRDPFLWNVACDFVINAWLVEMGVGTPPAIGLLHDAEFHGLGAEEIYDRLARDLRRSRKLATLRGAGQPDLIGEERGGPFVDAEEYCRRALAQGMDRVLYGSGRGTLPAGLIEEIRSLSQPPIPWDVRLAEWFDEHFPPPERRRSYARPSRRQSATPEIPRPSPLLPPEEERKSRVFGVVLDTSGSMEPQLLGKCLGAIASYSLAREVFAVRLVSCDAAAFDHGWVEPESLLERYSVRGRGGTVLQPGIDLLYRLAGRSEFPRVGPVLVITDGLCEERLDVPFDHAYLLPEGCRLPFVPTGRVFEIR
jgi:predicted metal-dependent peptidase